MSILVITVLAAVLGLAATITAFCLIVPTKKRETMKNPFLIFLHDLFNFKTLWLEKIFQFCYVLATSFTLLYGFFMLFYFEEIYHYGGYYSGGYYEKEWRGYYGLILMILGPIVVRITYEFIMMFVLLVQNVIDINHKLNAKKDDTTNTPAPTSEETSYENPENNYNQGNGYYQGNNQGNGYYQVNNNQGNGYYQGNNYQGNNYQGNNYQGNNYQGNGYNQ